jgi:dolichol-phosphate mannosyltransferase
MALISVVSPVYNEASNLQNFCDELFALFDKTSYQLEIIFCMDPSTDGTEELIKKLHDGDSRVKLISFSRRVGQDKATQAGIDFAGGDAVIVMDCDLQDPIGAIPSFLNEWESGVKVVYGKRISRKKENLIKKFSANLFYRVLNTFSESKIPRNTGDFRLIDKRVIVELRKFREDSFFLRALTPYVGFKTKEVPISRESRLSGHTKYNRYFGGLKTAMVAIFGYTNFIQKIFLFLFIFYFFCLVFIFIIFVILGLYPTATFAILMNLIVFFSFNILLLLSFMGWVIAQYLNRIYKQGMYRPNYIVDYVLGITRSVE